MYPHYPLKVWRPIRKMGFLLEGLQPLPLEFFNFRCLGACFMTPEDYEIFQYLIFAIACGLSFVGGFLACSR